MLFMAKFWNTVLSRFRYSDIILATAVRALELLHDFVAAQRDNFACLQT